VHAKNRTAIDPYIDDTRRAVTEFAARLSQGAVASDVHETSVLNHSGVAGISP
jgi:hypothetical protein